MPIKTYKINEEWGSIWYAKSDPKQTERCLVSILTLPGNEVKLGIRAYDEETESFYYPFELTDEPDMVKKLKDQQDDDGNEGDVT